MIRELPELPLEPEEGRMPLCPVCGQECEWVFRDDAGTIVGCDNCLEELDAWEVADCLPWEEEPEEEEEDW